MINFTSGTNFNLKSAHYCYLPNVSLFFILDSCAKSILLINCYNFRFFSLTAKVFPIFSILIFYCNQTSYYAKMFFLHFSIMSRRWFDDQDFIVVFNFFKCLRNLGNMAKIFLHALSILKKYNMIAFLFLESSEEKWR